MWTLLEEYKALGTEVSHVFNNGGVGLAQSYSELFIFQNLPTPINKAPSIQASMDNGATFQAGISSENAAVGILIPDYAIVGGPPLLPVYLFFSSGEPPFTPGKFDEAATAMGAFSFAPGVVNGINALKVSDASGGNLVAGWSWQIWAK